MHALGAQQRAQPGSSLGCVLLGCAYVQIRDFTPWGSSEGGLAPALEGDGGVCLHPPARPRWWPAQGRVQGPGDPQRAQNHTGRAGSVVAWLRTKMTSERTPRCVRTSGSPERAGLGGGVVGGWGTGEERQKLPGGSRRGQGPQAGLWHTTATRKSAPGRGWGGCWQEGQGLPRPLHRPMVNGHCVWFPAVASSSARTLVFLPQPEASPLILNSDHGLDLVLSSPHPPIRAGEGGRDRGRGEAENRLTPGRG